MFKSTNVWDWSSLSPVCLRNVSEAELVESRSGNSWSVPTTLPWLAFASSIRRWRSKDSSLLASRSARPGTESSLNVKAGWVSLRLAFSPASKPYKVGESMAVCLLGRHSDKLSSNVKMGRSTVRVSLKFKESLRDVTLAVLVYKFEIILSWSPNFLPAFARCLNDFSFSILTASGILYEWTRPALLTVFIAKRAPAGAPEIHPHWCVFHFTRKSTVCSKVKRMNNDKLPNFFYN